MLKAILTIVEVFYSTFRWMMRDLPVYILALLLLLAPTFASAVRVNSIYKAEVPVATQSAKDKALAIPIGLEQVFIKVSGNQQVLENSPSLQTALTHAETVAKAFNYATTGNNTKNPSYILTIHYDPDVVNKMLSDAGAPVWSQNRPLLLAWIVSETANSPPDLVDGSSVSEVQTLLKKSARTRGLAIILPLMDVTELTQVSVDDVVKKKVKSLQQAALRYASNGLILGHIVKKNAEYIGDWTLVLGDDLQSWTITGNSLAEVMTGATNNIADVLATRYAASGANEVQSQITLKIRDVKQQADLLRLMKYLQHLTSVAEVQMTSVVGDEITIDVSLRGSKDAFVQATGLAKNLVSLPSTNDEDDVLFYKWTP
ncbi:MAG: DUF2066 domain-containing protein [Gammaproteobacteria bacterium]|nr:DUF2066 domain-containing protein [Gammaproteobacteria bacterium]